MPGKLIILLLAILAASCVSQKKYQEMMTKRDMCEDENSKLKAKVQQLETENTELSNNRKVLTNQVENLQQDTQRVTTSLRNLTISFGDLERKYRLLEQKNMELLSANASEKQNILKELQNMHEQLQKKEDELKKLERQINSRQVNLDSLNMQLTTYQNELQNKEKKLNELQAILDKKDADVKALKNKVSDALLNFENKGLTINIRNGKVYVSLDESLLFASGSTAIDSKGEEALKKLGKVLETNADINIVVEGHTDSDPYKGSSGPIKDNWDLSVLRATTVSKTLLKHSKIDPKRITAAGRSEYIPVDTGTDANAKRKNRRTEIILTPKLDELFQIIESN